MMRIPFTPDAAVQHFQVLVPGSKLLNLRMVWNERAGFWFMDVESGGVSLTGLKVVPKWPLLREHRALAPAGVDIIALPSSSAEGDAIGFSDLGDSWNLFYVTPEDVEAWEAANGLG